VITVSMAAVIDAPRARVWRALTSPQELIRWDDRVVALAQGVNSGNGRPRQRYRWGSVWVDLRCRRIEVIPGSRLRAEIALGLLRFEATYTLSPEEADPARTLLSLRVAFPNSVPVVGGYVDRFDLRRGVSQLVSENISALQCWCEKRRPAADGTLPATSRPAAGSDLGRAAPGGSRPPSADA
jgi:uncharacterized protein YndB with AHSA1/START domain